MKLKRFNQQNRLPGFRGNSRASVRFFKTGMITFTASALKRLGLAQGQYVEIAQDEDSPEDWFIMHSTEQSGFLLRDGGKSGNAIFNNAHIGREFVNQFGPGKNSVACLLATEPVTIDGVEYWPIITSSAY